MGNRSSKELKGKKLKSRKSYYNKNDHRRPLYQFVHYSEEVLNDEYHKPPQWLTDLIKNLNLTEKSLAPSIHRGSYKDVFVFTNTVYSFQIIKTPIENERSKILYDRLSPYGCRYVYPQKIWRSGVLGKPYYRPEGVPEEDERDSDFILNFMVGKMESCVEGDMFEYINTRWKDETQLTDLKHNVIYMMHDLIESLLILHQQQIFVMDIKPENIIACKVCAEDGMKVGKRTLQWKFTDLDTAFVYDRYDMKDPEQFHWVRTLTYIPSWKRPRYRVDLVRNDIFALVKTFIFYFTFVFSNKRAGGMELYNAQEFRYMGQDGIIEVKRRRDFRLLKNNDFGKKFQPLMEAVESLYYTCLNYEDGDSDNERYLISRALNIELRKMYEKCKEYINQFETTGKWGDEVDNSPSQKYKRLVRRAPPKIPRTKSSVKFKF